MPRIPTALLDELKAAVSCQRVLEAHGHQLRRAGGELRCPCPLPGHDDRTPSFFVNPQSNLYCCHGCGGKGNVIQLLQALDGLGFIDACATLAQQAGIAFDADAYRPPVHTRPLDERCPLSADAEGTELDRQVIRYYHGRLLEHRSVGRGYLAMRGLADDRLIARWRLGFAQRGALGKRIPAKNRVAGARLRERLEHAGWFNADTGHEHLSGRIIVPIFDETADTLQQCYGRVVTRNLRKGTPDHKYLPRPQRGVWNHAGLVDGNGAAIICEAAIDALTLWNHGLEHVTFAYGTGGFTDDHLQALRDQGASDVFIAYDADAAGETAAAALADRLISAGLSAYRVRIPTGGDINDLALEAGKAAGEALHDAVRAAQWLGGAPQARAAAAAEEQAPAPEQSTPGAETPPSSAAPAAAAAAAPEPGTLPCAWEGDDLVVTCHSRTYRVYGLATTPATGVVPKLKLRIDARDDLHVDTIDLYQARQRQAFIVQAAGETGLNQDVIGADLKKLLGTLEAVQHQRRQRAEHERQAAEEPAVRAMSADERHAALELLQDPNLLERIADDLTRAGLVGETANKLVCYLAATSRLLDDPLAVLIQSSSAAGKSALMDAVLACMPDESMRRISTMTEKALYYLQGQNLQHTILGICEEEGMREAAYNLKILQSDGVLAQIVPHKDPSTGVIQTQEYRVEGPISLFVTTTASDAELDPELANRCLKMTVDEGRAQTAAIQAQQRLREAVGRRAAAKRRAAITQLHQHAQRLLEPLEVRNPYAPHLRFATTQPRLRRDHAKYLALIRTVALLHQYQRPIAEDRHTIPGETLRFITVTRRDVVIATELAAQVLGRCIDELTGPQRQCLEALHAYVTERAQAAEAEGDPSAIRFTRRAFRESAHCRWSQAQLARHLDALAELEYVLVHGGRSGAQLHYELCWDGQGAEGDRFLLGLVEIDQLPDLDTNGNSDDDLLMSGGDLLTRFSSGSRGLLARFSSEESAEVSEENGLPTHNGHAEAEACLSPCAEPVWRSSQLPVLEF